MTQTRQLAAIMFTDIIGYTALMGKDEEKALNLLEKNRQLHKSAIREFNGKWLKEMGDGTLVSFNTGSDAVNCARKIQEDYKKEGNISLRIGIHQGEMLFEGDDVFGDGVNIAARIEAIAPAGCIYISETVSRNIENKKGVNSKFIVEKTFKNVKYPVRVYKVIDDDEQGESIQLTEQKTNENSIAILPFVNMSNDPEQEYFCDGLSEELLNVLAQLDKIKVAARTSSFMFKNQNTDIIEIGKKLNVRTVLEGSVRKSGNRIRITVQLINIEDGFHLWSEKYDRENSDIFDIQDDITLAILKELKIRLMKDERESILRRDTDNPDAYKFYLNGRFNFHKFTGEGWLTGIKYYDKALEIEPNYAKAHAGRASCYLNLWHFSVLPPEQSFLQMQEATFGALELDDTIAETHLAMARYKLWYDFDIENAAKQFQKVFKYNANITDALTHYGFVQSFLGNLDLANSAIRKAKELDPFSPMIALDKMTVSWLSMDYEELLAEGLKTIEIHPQFWGAYWYTGSYYWKMDKLDIAVDYYSKAFTLFPAHFILSLLGCLYAVSKNEKRAKEILSELKKGNKEWHVGSFYCGIIYAALGEMDAAFQNLEKAGQERTGHLIFLDFYARDFIPSFNKDSRFKPYLKKVGIPIYKQKEQHRTKDKMH